VTVTVFDNVTSRSDTETIQVTVNEVNLAPVLNPIGNKTAPLGSLLTFTATATDADIPANTLTFSLDPGAPAGATIGAATGVFSWTPNVSGTSPVTIRVTDNGTPPLSDSETILITACVCSNTPPTLGPIGNKTVNELALLSFTATATDPDVPAQTLTFTLAAGNPAGSAITAGGAFTWTPTEAQGPGVYPITVIVTDNGVGNLSDSETIQVTVLEVNQAPVITNPGNKTADEGLLLTFNVVATDADLPAQTLTFSLSSPIPPGASITSGGTFRWTPAENEGGIDWPVTVCVNDGATGLTDCKTINITVMENNIAPVLASIGTKVVAPGATLSFVATATDADIPAQTLTFSLDPGAPPGASITAGGAFTWTTGPIGTFPITIRVTDNGSLSDSETFLVVVGQGSPPVLNPIADMTVNEGAVGTQTISASDPDNQSLQFSKQSGPFWVTIQTLGPTTGLITASPDLSAGGASYPVTAYVTDGSLSDQRAFMVQVTESCSPPVADAGGPYSGVTWFPVTFDGTGSTDPDGDIQAYGWDFGDGLTASGATVMHAYLQPGTNTVVLYVSDVCSGGSDSDQTTVTISDCYSTLAFVAGGNKQINLLNEKPTWCVQLEAFGGTFDVATIDPSSLVMRSTGTGSVSEIHALTDKTTVGGDRNGNGYTELSACFRKEDLRQLFSGVTGTQQVQVTFEGNLLVGGRTCSSLTITVKGGGGAVLAASISPNPLNPSAVLTFSTQERGPVLVQLFDVRGRLLRTLRDEADAAAGYHDVRIDGTTANGTRLSSGIYYIRIRAGAEEERRTITILK
jgi:chitodextrinase